MEHQRQTTLALKLLLPLSVLLFLFDSSAELWAQGPVPQAPNCYRSFAFTATGQTAFISNYGPGSPDGGSTCTEWILAYAVQNTGGSVTGLNLVVQSAPPGTGETVPGSWVTYAGSVVAPGVNPNTSVVGAQTVLNNATISIPFIRVALTSLTATGTTIVFGTLQGWSLGNGGGGGGGGGGGCAGTVITPCVTGAENSSAATITDFTCDQSAAITIAGSGLTQIVAASGSTQVRICHINFSNSAASNVTVDYGTGSNCGTGTTAKSGVYQSILAIALDFTSRDAWVFPASQAVCLNFASAVTAGGMVSYAQF